MDVQSATDVFLDHRRMRNVSPATLALYQNWLRFWLEWRKRTQRPPKLADVTIEELRAFFLYAAQDHVPHQSNRQRTAAPQRGLSPSSLDSLWRLLAALWKFLDDEELLTPTQARFFRAGRIPRPIVPEEPRPTYAVNQFEHLLRGCEQAATEEEQLRDRAILLLLLESGMRVGEVARLRDADVDLTNRTARVLGKGRRHGFVFWGPRAQAALMRYLRVRQGEESGALFRVVRGKNKGEGMTRDGIRTMVRRAARAAGVDLPKGAPIHALRHTFAHQALDAGLDISQVQQLLRHRSIETTTRYLRENPNRLREIHTRIFTKYRNRKP